MANENPKIPHRLEAYLPPVESEYDEKNELASSLDVLAQVVNILGIPDASFFNYSTAITNMSNEKTALSRSLNRLKAVEEELMTHLASLKHEYQLLAHWNQVLTPGNPDSLLPENSATMERRKESLVKKAKEYHKELEALIAQEPLTIPISLAQLMEQKEKNLVKLKELKEKKAKIKTFQGLPPNLDLARHELRAARKRQMELIQLRERLLARMADSIS
ncbi:hypothetical protein BDN70DRAFT_997414 [Pholiota conissans]|uniref:Uncharacterized protein n=1 Tax=Pholiota conissans TaxID=109636 RepID=A0A9P5YRQ6_9AGAR|nr:hypothetical protein BDN70DRAFT_997414 [Pholiota conissans]